MGHPRSALMAGWAPPRIRFRPADFNSLESARSNLSLKSHIASRISRKVADVLALSACPKVKMLLFRGHCIGFGALASPRALRGSGSGPRRQGDGTPKREVFVLHQGRLCHPGVCLGALPESLVLGIATPLIRSETVPLHRFFVLRYALPIVLHESEIELGDGETLISRSLALIARSRHCPDLPLLMLLSMERQHPRAAERWQLMRSGRGFSLVRQQPVPADQGRLPRRGRAGWQPPGGCRSAPSVLQVNFGDFEATGLLSTATSKTMNGLKSK
jgi:hypothetical protein